MKRSLTRNAAHWNLVVGLLAAAVTVSCATPPAASVPAALAVGPNQKLILSVQARGVQIYECAANKNDATHFAWSFSAPEATLFDGSGYTVGKHYAGPTWELNDGSKVIGTVIARDDGPTPDAIPWLLLGAKSSAGAGLLSSTKSIQRINTSGGKAPADGCDASRVGAAIRVPYTATYRFYGSDSQ